MCFVHKKYCLNIRFEIPQFTLNYNIFKMFTYYNTYKEQNEALHFIRKHLKTLLKVHQTV